MADDGHPLVGLMDDAREYMRRRLGSSVTDNTVPAWSDGVDRMVDSMRTMPQGLVVNGPTQDDTRGRVLPPQRITPRQVPADVSADQNRIVEMMADGYRPTLSDRAAFREAGVWPSRAELAKDPRNENISPLLRLFQDGPLTNWRRTYSGYTNPRGAWWVYGTQIRDAVDNQMFRNHVYGQTF
jgi:hypothetical protein